MLPIFGKLPSFRGASRFTTWAHRFVVLEVSGKLGRHYWRRHPADHLEAENWDRLPAALRAGPGQDAEHAELVNAVRQAIDETLTEHQRRMFVAVVLNQVPWTRSWAARAPTGTRPTRRSSTPAVRSAGT